MSLISRVQAQTKRWIRDEAEFHNKLLTDIELIVRSLETARSPDVNSTDLTAAQLLDLRINEYNAVKAEQRTRLDAANKLISYHAVALAAAVGTVSTLLSNGKIDLHTVSLLLLWLPILSVPFAYAQYNEELMVRRMGAYIGKLKAQISQSEDGRYWMWDGVHASSGSWVLWVSGFFRGGLTLIFAGAGILGGIALRVYKGWTFSKAEIGLITTDVTLLAVGAWIAVAMWRVDLEG